MVSYRWDFYPLFNQSSVLIIFFSSLFWKEMMSLIDGFEKDKIKSFATIICFIGACLIYFTFKILTWKITYPYLKVLGILCPAGLNADTSCLSKDQLPLKGVVIFKSCLALPRWYTIYLDAGKRRFPNSELESAIVGKYFRFCYVYKSLR